MEVGPAVGQQAQSPPKVRGRQLQLDPGMAFVEPRDRERQHGLHPGRPRGDAEAAGAAGQGGIHLLFRGFDLAQDVAGKIERGRAEGGQADAGGQAFEQPAPELPLEPDDDAGQRRLGPASEHPPRA